jgi:hypothetical protein
MSNKTIDAIEGKLCQVCGKEVDGGAPGNPRSCKECQWTHEIEPAMHILSRQHLYTFGGYPFAWKVVGDFMVMACIDENDETSLAVLPADRLADWSRKYGKEVDERDFTPVRETLSEQANEELYAIEYKPF